MQAFRSAGVPDEMPAMVHPASQPEFGDYQADGVMTAAKRLRTQPRKLAEAIIAKADLADLADRISVAGPGFINIVLREDLLTSLLAKALNDERLGVSTLSSPQTVVVDYSGPNLAKEMHVGHLRSSIIGDAIARILEFRGHRVIRQNHMGDFGTQFGMLIAYMRDVRDVADTGMELSDIEECYRRAKDRCDHDPSFAELARLYVLRLQQGDPDCTELWRRYVAESLKHCLAVYDLLGLGLGPEHMRPESSYKEDFQGVMEDLASAGLLRESEGAQCVFLDVFKGKDDQPLPFIVRKSDGAFLYSTFDLAALKHRVRHLEAERILYVHDSRQALHFRQLFAVGRAAGLAPEAVDLAHIAFGTMLGKDGKPFKTRSGGTVKLTDLLDEARERAFQLVTTKNPALPEPQRREIARVVGIGAVKYADLAMNRTTDYMFSWETMLSLQGNTAPYMQYAYARVMSIFRKAGEQKEGSPDIALNHPAERNLALLLLQFHETLDTVCRDCCPHVLCAWLYEVAGRFMTFYEQCPVLQADGHTRSSRLSLCRLTARTLKTALALLGIGVIEEM